MAGYRSGFIYPIVGRDRDTFFPVSLDGQNVKSFHHLAITTKDMPWTHAFYTEAMSFRLAKVVKQTMARSWAKHFVYDTGNGELMPFLGTPRRAP